MRNARIAGQAIFCKQADNLGCGSARLSNCFGNILGTLAYAGKEYTVTRNPEYMKPKTKGKDKGKDNASAFEILGYHNGLQISAYEADPYGDVYGGGLYTLTEENAPVTRMYLGETYEAGKALFESLKVAAE